MRKLYALSLLDLKPVFKFFLKTRNAKYFIISLKNHYTLIRTLLISEWNSSCNGLRLPRKEACEKTHKGQAGLPYKHVAVIVLLNQNGEAYYCRAFFLRMGQISYL